MTKEEYQSALIQVSSEEDKIIFVQKYYFNGIPLIFNGREDDFYSFSKKIADNFQINYNDINIVGSSRFGFSPYKFTDFSYDSDIDVTICNEVLFEKYFELISNYTYKLRHKEIILRREQYLDYVKFLKYFSTGWMRPDLLPKNTIEFKELRENWDNFFKTLSYGKAEVGNYKVKAGLFKNQRYAEKYYKTSITISQQKINSFK